ncbi:MAG: hypothetical protein GY801_46110 [bacterium]|nr:hypothetical protein [bacterium]
MSLNIVWLGQKDCHDPKDVGPKAAHCSQLFTHFNVPPGFCMPAIDVPLSDGSPGDPDLSPDVEKKILDAYQLFAERLHVVNPAVGVRSSCIDEDRDTTSFAGQHDTYLNVSGGEAVVEAVKKCLDSARNESALFYRKFHQLSTSGVRIAVIVQQFIAADTAAVAFSINPITGNGKEIIINANLGLGPSIVDGSATPDTYIVDKDNPTDILDHQIHKKMLMTVPDAGGGIKNVTIPKFLRSKSVLSDAHISEIAATVLNLEQQKGYAVDIECAFKSDTLYLLQCRPVSTTN